MPMQRWHLHFSMPFSYFKKIMEHSQLNFPIFNFFSDFNSVNLLNELKKVMIIKATFPMEYTHVLM